MHVLLIVLHVLVSIFLIAVVLLQRGKGAEVGAVFGGGASSTVFGSRGAGSFLSRLTTASAIVFMGTSLALSYITTSADSDALFQDEASLEAPADENTEAPVFEQIETVPPVDAPAPSAPTGSEPAAESAAPAAAPTDASGLTPLEDPAQPDNAKP